ncbi:MAG: hypothetical protein JWQ12_1860 [Glaciihabitans sp.]|nr:hypothetical protein [Glaciihabitans sp.]
MQRHPSTAGAKAWRATRRTSYLLLGAALLAAGSGAAPAFAVVDPDANPNFGPNVTIFSPDQSVDSINATLAGISHETEFSSNRHAVFFLPGTYGSAAGEDDPSTATGIVNGEVGYYTAVAGLGSTPDDVTINGAIHVEGVQTNPGAPWEPNGDAALTNFWRSMSNLAINPIQQPTAAEDGRTFKEGVANPHQLRWAVSQAAPLRRVNVKGDLSLFPRFGGYSSGGYLANSTVSGTVVPGSQQQWYSRDSSIGAWDGGVWNMVFSGVTGAPAQSFPSPPETTLASTPVSRDNPFIYVTGDGAYKVFVPKARTNASDTAWSTSAANGTSIGIHNFFIARPSSTITQINHALATGKNLILTPGIYRYSKAIEVKRSNTVVLGMGFATLAPTNGNAVMSIGNVQGVSVSGLIVDAGAKKSKVLVKVGPTGSTAGVASNPTTLNDVFFRVGGAGAGKTVTALEVNSNHVLLDDVWAWRADHGAGVGWTSNTADHGLVVNGDNVTALGLAVEHFQKSQVVWRGNGGQTIFYQSELPYDPPTQAAWMSGSRNGYPSYEVADSVTTHSAYGLGVYSFFNVGPSIFEESAIVAPKSPNVTFTDMVSVYLNGNGGITHVINDVGGTVQQGTQTSYVVSYPPADTTNPTLVLTASSSTPSSSGWFRRAVKLTLTTTDDFSPKPTITESVDGGPATTVTGSVKATQGDHTIEFRATDSSGNLSDVVTWTGKVDTATPHTHAALAGKVLTLTASDAASGVATIQYLVSWRAGTKSSAWLTYSGPVTLPSGKHVVSYRATDVAGNVSGTRHFTVH